MHPNRAFAVPDRDVLADAAAIGFAHLFATTPDGPMVVHAPITQSGDAVHFHVARGNRITRYLDGADVLVSVSGVQGYVSPNWYAQRRDQVPTWNYIAIEMEGRATALTQDDLIAQLDALAATHEPRVIPDDPWSRAKMDPRAFARMLGGIRGFGLVPQAVRATAKLSQNKTAADRDGAVAGLRRAGHTALADAIVNAAPGASGAQA
ncbi:MAG TPA: FMN-binding negative transcriptional regulator [Sphingomonas sp.]|jgi:transcriptional regulator|nr:FMN-binding negative transcriptional regulator [Sphingomonas sp.]